MLDVLNDRSLTFKESSGILLVHSEKDTSCFTVNNRVSELYKLYLPQFGESELGSPDFALATESISADQFESEKKLG